MTNYTTPTAKFITARDAKTVSSFLSSARIAIEAGKMSLRDIQTAGMELKFDDIRLRSLVSVYVRSKATTLSMFRVAGRSLSALVAGSIAAETEAAEINAKADELKEPMDSVEAIVDIIHRSEGKGKGFAAEFPAYSVMRVEADVMVITRKAAKMLCFATPRPTRTHGTQYDMFTMSGVGAYAAEYGHDEAQRIERAKANGHELFFMVKHGVSITAHKRDHGFHLEILPGQKVMFDGVLMEVRPAANDNLKLVIL